MARILSIGLLITLWQPAHALPSTRIPLGARAHSPVTSIGLISAENEALRSFHAGGLERLKGGSGVGSIAWTPNKVFNAYFGGLAVGVAGIRLAAEVGKKKSNEGGQEKKSEGFISLQRRFLCVFWLFKLADWLHGPYFYEVCARLLLAVTKLPRRAAAQLCCFHRSLSSLERSAVQILLQWLRGCMCDGSNIYNGGAGRTPSEVIVNTLHV